jgi:hypothetical protein
MSNNLDLDSLILKIETSEKEYSILLQQYNAAYKTYVDNLQNTSATVPFVSIPGRTFWGTNGLKEGGEYSVGNLAFKTLRYSGHLQKISDYRLRLFDKELSLEDFKKFFVTELAF